MALQGFLQGPRCLQGRQRPGDHQGLPQARSPIPSGSEQDQGGRGEVQGHLRGLRCAEQQGQPPEVRRHPPVRHGRGALRRRCRGRRVRRWRLLRHLRIDVRRRQRLAHPLPDQRRRTDEHQRHLLDVRRRCRTCRRRLWRVAVRRVSGGAPSRERRGPQLEGHADVPSGGQGRHGVPERGRQEVQDAHPRRGQGRSKDSSGRKGQAGPQRWQGRRPIPGAERQARRPFHDARP